MKIEKIEVKNKQVKIYLSDNSFFEINLETYLNQTILINEEITNKEIENIKKANEIQIAKSILIEKLSRKKLSVKECELFLKEYNLNDKEAKQIISELERNYVINDNDLMINIIDYCLFNKKGLDVIKRKLIERKIKVDEEIIIKNINEEKYINNIKYLIEKYQKMAKNKSEKQLKQYIQIKLMDNGYKLEEFNEFIKLKKVDENVIVTKEIQKFFTLREKNKENIAKITKKLLSKGFNYDIIKKVLGSDMNETN